MTPAPAFDVLDDDILVFIPALRGRFGHCTVTVLAGALSAPRSTVYRHLRRLRDRGLVTWGGAGSIRLTSDESARASA